MILDRLKNSQNLKNDVAGLSADEKQTLFQEVQTLKTTLQNQKVQYETQKQTVENTINEIMQQLSDEFNIRSLEEANAEIEKLTTEINTEIEKFVTELKGFESNDLQV